MQRKPAHYRYIRKRVERFHIAAGTVNIEFTIGSENKHLPLQIHWALNTKAAVHGSMKLSSQHMGLYNLRKIRIRHWYNKTILSIFEEFFTCRYPSLPVLEVSSENTIEPGGALNYMAMYREFRLKPDKTNMQKELAKCDFRSWCHGFGYFTHDLTRAKTADSRGFELSVDAPPYPVYLMLEFDKPPKDDLCLQMICEEPVDIYVDGSTKEVSFQLQPQF